MIRTVTLLVLGILIAGPTGLRAGDSTELLSIAQAEAIAAEPQIDLGAPQPTPPANASYPQLQLPPLPPEPSGPPAEPQRAPTPAPSGGYLGLVTDAVPDAVAAHLSDKLEGGSGLLVTQVVPGSPAEAAGIRHNDILVSYDETPLSSFAQLFQLARADEPGQTVELDVIRAGAVHQVTVTLGDPPARMSDPVQVDAQRVAPTPVGPALTAPPAGVGVYEPTVVSNYDIATFLGDTRLPPDVRFAIQQRAPYLMATYRVVALQYALVAPGVIHGTAVLADPQGNRYEFEASGTLPQIKQQLVGHLLTLP